MVARGLASSRSIAQRLIDRGAVTVDGQRVTKPSEKVSSEDPLTVDPNFRVWVSRAAEKLLAALDTFPIEVGDKRCLDVGASTGGFTEVLLDKGARSVVALDVGHGQLHDSLREDPRVMTMEGSNVRDLEVGAVGGPFDVVTVDLSFISLKLVAAKLAELTASSADAVMLIKPQFEVQKPDLGKGGILRDPERRSAAVRSVLRAMRDTGLAPQGLIQSPIEGSDGNVEFLLWCRRGAKPLDLEVPG